MLLQARAAEPRGAVGKQDSNGGGGVAIHADKFNVPTQTWGQGRLESSGELLVVAGALAGFGQGRQTVVHVFAERMT